MAEYDPSLFKRIQKHFGGRNPTDYSDTGKKKDSNTKSKTKKTTTTSQAKSDPYALPDGSAFVGADQETYIYDAGKKVWRNIDNSKKLKQVDGYRQFQTADKKRIRNESLLKEGGAMPGVGPIHIDEIEPTLDALERVLKIDLKNNVLGSVGKREFSGDIDVALQIDPEDLPAFIDRLKATPEVLEVEKTSVIMTKVKIADYDESKQTTKPRTGFVQVDFMPGDPGWLKTYYHSPSEKESKYKGVFRNILISSIALVHNRKDSEETIDDGRPVESERWLWSPTEGLVRVKRTPVPKKSGVGYTKKNNNEIIGKPIRTATEIAAALDLNGAEDLNSYETLKVAIEKNYPKEEVEKILNSFADNSVVKDIGVPDDLKQEESLAERQMKRILSLAGYNRYEI